MLCEVLHGMTSHHMKQTVCSSTDYINCTVE